MTQSKNARKVLILCGDNDDGKLGEDSEICCPPVISKFQATKISSFSTSFFHTVIITKEGEIFSAGNYENGKVVRSGPIEFGDFSKFEIKDEEGHKWYPISAVCGTKYTLFMVSESKNSEKKKLAISSEFIKNDNPLFLNIGEINPVAIFGGPNDAAAIDTEGSIIFITFEPESENDFGVYRLPDNEKAVDFAFCNMFVLALSSSGLIFFSNIEKGHTLDFFRDKKFDSIRFIQISGITFHALAISEDGRAFGIGTNEDGQLGFEKDEIQYTTHLNEIKSLSKYKIVSCEAGYYHSFFRTSCGKILACGKNNYGQFFTKKPENKSFYSPVEIGIKKDITFLVAGSNCSAAFIGCDPSMSPNRTIKVKNDQKKQETEKIKQENDTQKSKQQKDTQKSKQEKDTQKSKKEKDTQKSKPQNDTQKSKQEKDTQKSKQEKDTQKSKQEKDTQKSKPQNDTQKSKPQNDTQKSKPQNNTQKSKQEQFNESERLSKAEEEIQRLKNENMKLKEENLSLRETIEKMKSDKVHSINSEPESFEPEEIEKLKVARTIGRGQNSEVFEVTNEQQLALKVLYLPSKTDQKETNTLEQFQDLLEKSKSIYYSFDHPNILKTHGICIGDKTHAPSMLIQYCPKNLSEIVDMMSQTEKVCSIFEICCAMEEVHKRNLVHKYLNPENILIDKKGHVKVSDIEKSFLFSNQELNLKNASNKTMSFMAPEVLNKSKKVDCKADVYSFGKLAYYILTSGEIPKISIADQANGKKPQFTKNINKVSSKLINKCWSKNPSERPEFSEIIDFIKNMKFELIDGVESDIDEINAFLNLQ